MPDAWCKQVRFCILCPEFKSVWRQPANRSWHCCLHYQAWHRHRGHLAEGRRKRGNEIEEGGAKARQQSAGMRMTLHDGSMGSRSMYQMRSEGMSFLGRQRCLGDRAHEGFFEGQGSGKKSASMRPSHCAHDIPVYDEYSMLWNNDAAYSSHCQRLAHTADGLKLRLH